MKTSDVFKMLSGFAFMFAVIEDSVINSVLLFVASLLWLSMGYFWVDKK